MVSATRRQQLDTDRDAAELRLGFLHAFGGSAAARKWRLNPSPEVEHFSPLRALGAALLFAHLYGIGRLDHAAVPAAIAALVDVVGVERGFEGGFGAAARAEPHLAGQPLEIRVLEPVRRQVAPIKHDVDLAALLGGKNHGSPLIDVGVTTVPIRPVGAGICEPTLYPDSGCVGPY